MIPLLLLQVLISAHISSPKPPCPPYRVDTTRMVQDSFSTDSGVDIFGTQYVVQDGAIYEKENQIDGKFEVRLIDAPKELFNHRQLKCRYGHFYAQFRSKVLKFDRTTSRWQVILESPRPFSTFEVNFTGQVLLFGTFAKPDPEDSRHPMTLGNKDLEEGAQIEVWEMGGDAPVSRVSYDSTDKDLAKAVEGLTSYNRTWMYRDWIVFYNDYTGRMGAYNPETKSQKWMKTPWAGLTLEGLKSWEKSPNGLKILNKTGQVLIDCIDVPLQEGIQFCPDEVSLKVVYFRIHSLAEVNEIKKELVREPNVNPTVVLPLPVSPDSHRFKIGIGTMNLEKSEITEDLLLDPPPTRPIWVNGEGQIVPLDTILRPSKPSADKKTEIKGKGSSK